MGVFPFLSYVLFVRGVGTRGWTRGSPEAGLWWAEPPLAPLARVAQFAVEDAAGMEAAVVAETERQRHEAALRPGLADPGGGGGGGLPPGAGLLDPAAAAAAAANAVGVPGLAGDALIEASAEFLGKLNGIVQENWQICAAVLQSTATLDSVAKNPPSMEVMSTWQWTKIGEQIQEHVDYLNQSHEAKVKRIDEEYHSFMEKVRPSHRARNHARSRDVMGCISPYARQRYHVFHDALESRQLNGCVLSLCPFVCPPHICKHVNTYGLHKRIHR